MPNVVQFDPRPAVLYWHHDEERRTRQQIRPCSRHSLSISASQGNTNDIDKTKEKRLVGK